MRNGIIPDPSKVFPVPGFDTVTYIKPTVKNPNIMVGDFTYFSDTDFESHVTHHYDFYGDKLIIGKFCQIASGVYIYHERREPPDERRVNLSILYFRRLGAGSAAAVTDAG